MPPRPSDNPPVAGMVVSGYVLEKVIGSGGMGTVYAAHHPVIAKRAAVKIIRLDALTSATSIQRFINEAQLVNKIHHPNIVDIFGFDQLPDGRPAFVMELLEGETLRALLDRRRRVSAVEAVKLVLPVVEALAAAHAMGVIHRDLKPENLFVVDAERPIVKVLDFGIAKIVDLSRVELANPSNDLWIGTPQYMSPEQCRGVAIDGRSDLYSLGLILYEMLSGTLPFSARDPGEWMMAHMEARPQPIQTQVAVDPRLSSLIDRLLSKDTAPRPASASALEKELRDWMARAENPASSPVVQTHPALAGPAPRASATAATMTDLSTLPTGTSLEENRLCTMVFADISGFTELSERLTPEQVKEIIDGCFARMTAVIEKHGGYVDKYIGDCVMAVFGIPRSTDNDAERAVRAALALRDAVVKFGARNRRLVAAKTALAVRIGINTGVVFAGRVGARRDVTVTGDAVNVASRLQGAAPPSSIVIGAETYRHVAGLFEVEELPQVQAKGKSEPLRWYRVDGVADHRLPVRADQFYGVDTRFVGRRGELERVLDALDHAVESRRAHCATVIAPAGIGKTRLRNEVFQAVTQRDRGELILLGRGSHMNTDAMYDLVGGLLRRRFQIGAEDPREVVEQKLRNAVRSFGRKPHARSPSVADSGAWATSPTSLLPSLPPLASLPPPPSTDLDPSVLGDAIATLAVMLGADTQSRLTVTGDSIDDLRARISSAVARLFELLSSRAPIILLCDALEAADDASLDLLDYLLLRLVDAPFFVLATARPEFFERRPHWGEGSERHSRTVLDPLSHRATEEIARDLLRRAPSVSSVFIRQLVDQADGNPLVLKETVRVLVETGGVTRGADDVWTVQEDTLDRLRLPTTLQGIVQARLDRLPADARTAVQRASVIGRVFWEGALDTMDAHPGEEPPRVRAWLERLRAVDFIRERERSSFGNEREYAFADTVTREAAYASLSTRHAAHYHAKVARWLEQRGTSFVESNPALLAKHFDRAEMWPDALQYYTLAGTRAATLGQNADAMQSFRRACDIADSVKGLEPEDPESHDSLTSFVPSAPVKSMRPNDQSVEELRVATWTQRVDLRLSLGDAMRRLGRLDEAGRVYREALSEILRRERRRDATLDARVVAEYEGRVELRLGLVERIRGAHEVALAHFLVARQQIGADGDPKLLAPLLAAIGFALQRLRRFQEGTDACRAGLQQCQRIPPGSTERIDAACRLLTTMGGFAYEEGRFVRAERFYRQAWRLVDERRFPELAARAINNVAATLFRTGDVKSARELFRRSLDLKEQLGDLGELVIAYTNLAEMDMLLGHGAVALEKIQRAAQLAEALHAADVLPEVYRVYGGVLKILGALPAAVHAAERAFDYAMAPEGHSLLGGTGLMLAECCVAAAGARKELDAPTRAALDTAIASASARVPAALEEAGADKEASKCRALFADAANA